MKVCKSIISTLLLFLILSSSVLAQKNLTEEADKSFRLKQYYASIDMYKKAYPKIKNRIEKNRVLFQIGECYRFTNNTRRAENQYKRLVRIKYQKHNPLVMLYYADALKTNMKYEDALIHYNKYKVLAPDDIRGETGAESCIKAQKWLDNPTRYEVENEKRLNTRENEWAPEFIDKKKYKKLTFTSSRESGRKVDVWTGQSFSDIYITQLDRKGSWSTPVLLEEEGTVNSELQNEGEASFNKRSSTIYFSRCLFEKKEKLPCQIYTAKKKGRGWGDANVVPLHADSFDVIHPTISKDELTIYFASNKKGGHGGFDLYMAKRKRKTKSFGKPVNLGPNVNTPGHEVFPYYRYDTVLYFSSNGHVGIGGFDIYKIKKTDNRWGTPKNMKVPVNSNGDDIGITFIGKKEEGYLASNRKGGRGGDDIYYFILPPLLYTLQGIVKNDSTLQFIPGATVKLLGSDGSSIITKTNPSGHYSFDNTQILVNTSYELSFSKNGYFTKNGKTTTVGLPESTDLVLDKNLPPIPVKPIPLPEIHYKLADTVLQEQFEDSLIGLVETMEQNPTIVIELRSHTDFRDTDEKNLILSRGRANSVVSYLIERGIDPLRLKAKGLSESVPRTLDRNYNRVYIVEGSMRRWVNVNFTKGMVLDEPFIKSLPRMQGLAAHQLNRRTEFRILRTDFVPSARNDTIVPEGSIELVLDPNKNVLNYTLGTGAAPLIPCIVNGHRMSFMIKKNSSSIEFSYDEAMKFLKDGKIYKSDFVLKDRAINKDGTIVENAVMILESLAVGDAIVNNIEVTITKGLQAQVIIGDSKLSEFGTYTIDKENKQIIFR